MAVYQPLPSVGRVRPRSLRLADLYLRTGDAQAEAELRSGAIKAQLFGDIGRTIGQTASAIVSAPQVAREQAAAAASQAQQAELGALQLSEAKRGINERENYDLAMSAGSREKTLAALKDRPELYEKAQGHFQRIDTSMKQLLGDAAAGIADFGYTPEAAMAAMDDLLDQGFDERKIEPFRAAVTKDPANIKRLVDGLLSQSPDPRHQAMAKPDLLEVSPGATVVDKRNPNAPILTAPNPAAEAAAAARAVDDERQLSALEETKRHNRAMEAKPPSMVPVVVQTPQGPAVLDRRTNTAEPITMHGQTVGVAPTAAERMDSRKFSKAAPVLRGIEQLTERINTQQGLIAKMSGGVEKVKAQANYNDDVAEYESLISGFTPMVARALGHTGVLTQQDVDSVRNLFPRPGDSKTLRDRKINRMMNIIGELEGADLPGGGPSAAPAAPTNPFRKPKK